MPGERGPLKLAGSLTTVSDAVAETAAAATNLNKPFKPDYIANDPRMTRVWDEIVDCLYEAGLISPSDGPTLEIALHHYRLAVEAAERLTDLDLLVGSEKAPQKNPLEAVVRLNSNVFLKYVSALGLSFVSRARTPTDRPGKHGNTSDDNPFDDDEAAG